MGSPIEAVRIATPTLNEVIRLGIAIKASDVITPVIDILSDRHPRFAVALDRFSDGGPHPNNCAPLLQQMYSDIVKVCEDLESTHGQRVWYAQAHAYNANFSKSRRPRSTTGKGRGRRSGKGKGKGTPYTASYSSRLTNKYRPLVRAMNTLRNKGKGSVKGKHGKGGGKGNVAP